MIAIITVYIVDAHQTTDLIHAALDKRAVGITHAGCGHVRFDGTLVWVNTFVVLTEMSKRALISLSAAFLSREVFVDAAVAIIVSSVAHFKFRLYFERVTLKRIARGGSLPDAT